MKVLGIIPARAGSKRVPGKNLRRVAGRTLVEHAIEHALAATRLSRVIVSSDDPQVLALAAARDPGLVLVRPESLATDTAPAIGYVSHALASLETAGERPYEAVAILQPTSPLRIAADIDGTIELLDRTPADSAVSVVEVEHAIHPLKLKVLDGDRLLPFLEEEQGRMMAHELPPLFVRNCAVYVSRRATLESGDLLGRDSRGYRMPRERSVDINDELDLEFAEFLLRRREC